MVKMVQKAEKCLQTYTMKDFFEEAKMSEDKEPDLTCCSHTPLNVVGGASRSTGEVIAKTHEVSYKLRVHNC